MTSTTRAGDPEGQAIVSGRHGPRSPRRVRNMQVQFITSVAIVAPDPVASKKLYLDTLGLPLEQLGEDYFATEQIAGSKHFGVWPLTQAAQACYGAPDWPLGVPIPQASIEFEVASINA